MKSPTSKFTRWSSVSSVVIFRDFFYKQSGHSWISQWHGDLSMVSLDSLVDIFFFKNSIFAKATTTAAPVSYDCRCHSSWRLRLLTPEKARKSSKKNFPERRVGNFFRFWRSKRLQFFFLGGGQFLALETIDFSGIFFSRGCIFFFQGLPDFFQTRGFTVLPKTWFLRMGRWMISSITIPQVGIRFCNSDLKKVVFMSPENSPMIWLILELRILNISTIQCLTP